MKSLARLRGFVGARVKGVMNTPKGYGRARLQSELLESESHEVEFSKVLPRSALMVTGSLKWKTRFICSRRSLALTLFVVALLKSQFGKCQVQQFVLDTVSEQTWIIDLIGQGVTSTADGGTIVQLTTDYGEGLWKSDQDGYPAWYKQYDISSQRRARMPDGGVVFCEITGYSPDGDTSHIHLRIVRVDPQGELLWSKLLEIHDPYVTSFNNGWLYVASDEEGRCLITMSRIQSSAYQWFYCLAADGNLLWSRNYLFNVNADHVEQLCSDRFGGWYFASYEWGASVFHMGRLNFMGDMTWYNSYTVTGPEFWLGGICSSEFEAIAVGGYDAETDDGDYRWFVMRLDLNGNLEWLRVSATTEPMLSQCSATEAGEILVSGGQNGYQSYMARLSNDGNVISSFRADTIDVAGTSITTWLSEWDLLDTTLTFGNYLRSQTNGGSPASYKPAVWRLPVSDLAACGTEPNELASVLASNSNVAVQDQPYSAVTVPVTITDTVCTVTSFTPIGVSDYCYYFTGVASVVPPEMLGRATPTLLVKGEQISVTAPAARCGISVHDAHSGLLYRTALAPNGQERIPTSAWVPGLYFVRFQPEDGGSPNVVKVVIQ